MTVHDKLSAPGVVFYFHAVVFAHVKAGVRSGSAKNLSKLPCDRRSVPLVSPKPEFSPHDSSQLHAPMTTQAIRRRLKSHR